MSTEETCWDVDGRSKNETGSEVDVEAIAKEPARIIKIQKVSKRMAKRRLEVVIRGGLFVFWLRCAQILWLRVAAGQWLPERQSLA
jgi:hypothetical protein